MPALQCTSTAPPASTWPWIHDVAASRCRPKSEVDLSSSPSLQNANTESGCCLLQPIARMAVTFKVCKQSLSALTSWLPTNNCPSRMHDIFPARPLRPGVEPVAALRDLPWRGMPAWLNPPP